MTPPDASLSRLLRLVEEWQVGYRSDRYDLDEAEALYGIDIHAFRAAAQQHAEALRQVAEIMTVVMGPLPCKSITDPMLAVIDFLRLDPKEEA